MPSDKVPTKIVLFSTNIPQSKYHILTKLCDCSYTPLAVCVKHCHKEAARILLEAGANPDATDNYGYSNYCNSNYTCLRVQTSNNKWYCMVRTVIIVNAKIMKNYERLNIDMLFPLQLRGIPWQYAVQLSSLLLLCHIIKHMKMILFVVSILLYRSKKKN